MKRNTADRRNPAEIEERIGYTFNDRSLLERALTRLAYTLEAPLPPAAHMDALATLGDAVINVVVVEAVIAGGVHDKGAISNRKMNLVNMTRLRALAEDLDLEEYVRWGKGEAAQAVWTSGRVLAECMEALIGAVYLDGGMGAAAGVLGRLGLTEKA
ncbi:MAG TPA: ribonuclease III domain-containing protein [Candidatus Methanoculleus thermohydrogenotrophicum]|jgi:ribonuclease-3|nr:ribonuclease III domain-containing protein [Candidatus Methanoculleus thermohydrogenotrophicum]NLM82551.1 ribonuclease III [Candidatus Methanoculleus thermohydrogenotrophicum]HOB17392.1 ribonuclease III domain-containing protein [Candidatus Methanoculleus thermohydrogenotrophicum]HPZ37620.1 ribonuclease III domain-containing protein [Candidatus Methanoculleus thermohydrogenotrophicum]HQC90640.1 ribonuclease III domain-containing protein [Candidatus Methanoculleus thermohydrogenotrophicum]